MTDQDRKTAEEIVNRINGDISRNGRLDATHYRRYVQQIEAALSDARGRWMQVGDELPENGRFVLTICEDGIIQIAWRGKGKWFAAYSDFDAYPVTHWREMPEPPEEGGGNG